MQHNPLPGGLAERLCEDTKVAASGKTSLTARTCNGACVHAHDPSRLRRAFALGFHEHAFYMRERFVKRDVWILVGGTA